MNTTNAFAVNGNSQFGGNVSVVGTLSSNSAVTCGSLTLGDLANWAPTSGTTYSLPSANFNNPATGTTGYYIFPGGFCIEWGWEPDPGNTQITWVYPKALTYVYGGQVSRTDQNTGSAAYVPAKINSTSTTQMNIDAGYGSTDKSAVFILVFGKV